MLKAPTADYNRVRHNNVKSPKLAQTVTKSLVGSEGWGANWAMLHLLGT